MSENVVYVRATRREIRNAVRKIPAVLSGRDVAAQPIAQALLIRAGMAILGRIKAAFVVKARGGTDDCGLSWPALSPKTIAYSRKHPGVPRSKQRASFRPSWMLTDRQRKRWYQLNAVGGAAYAWMVIKSEGGKTLIGTYGGTSVEILRDTGLLLNSLSPGVPGSVPDQVFQIGRGEFTIGTSRRFAGTHHRGIPGRLPQRRLWADPKDWPQSWWQDCGEAMQDGLVEVALFLIQRSA